MPQPKKHASTRRRRNKAPTAATLIVEPEQPSTDYGAWTLPALRHELAERNAERDFPLIPAKNTKAAHVELLRKDDDPVPDLPEHPSGRWHPMSVEWWRDAWLSPMRREWHQTTDRHNVFIAVLAFDDYIQGRTAQERQKAYGILEKSVKPMGLTPMARRTLEWTTANAEEATRKAQRGKAGPINGADDKSAEKGKQPAKKADPRAILHAV